MARIATVILATTLNIVLFTAPSCLGDNILYSGETLYAGQSLTYGSYVFIIQNDCNLVLYDGGGPIWASNTGGLASGCRLSMQADGNLVVYSPGNRVIWASNTAIGDANYVLILQKDRNAVIYGPARWATGTNTETVGIPGSAARNSTIITARTVAVASA